MQQATWLPISREFGTIRVGSWTQPGQPGCFACAERRRFLALDDSELFLQVRERLEQKDPQSAQPRITTWALQAVILVVEAEVSASLEHVAENRTGQAVLHLQLSTLQWSRHHFLPDPLCPLCGRRPADSADSASVHLQPRQKVTPTTFRVRSLGSLSEQISDTYVDREVGLVYHLGKSLHALYPTAVASICLEQDQRQVLPGVGRTLNYKQSYLAAIMEALERYGGQIPQGRRPVVRAPVFANLASRRLIQ